MNVLASDSNDGVEQDAGLLKFVVKDKASGALLPCRIYLRNSAGQYQKCEPLPFFIDNFTCEGVAELKLVVDEYHYEIESGKEYSSITGSIKIDKQVSKTISVELERMVDLARHGWYAGDMHNHRTLQEMPLLMRAENVHIGHVPFHWNIVFKRDTNVIKEDLLTKLKDNRFIFQNSYEEERNDGVVIIFNVFEHLDTAKIDGSRPPCMAFIEEAMAVPNSWIHAERPYWWEYPTWLACGRIDSIEIINNYFWRNALVDNEAWGRPRDKAQYPSPFGNALYTQDLYFHTLNSGFRIPPAAGSASGVIHSCLGYNRVYVHVDGQMTWDKWWAGLKAGQCFVTNGPLPQVKANGNWPGHVFTAPAGEAVKIDLEMELVSRDKVSRIEVISNGKVIRSLSLEEWKASGGLGELKLTKSGWFLVRVLTDIPQTYRYAMTGPFYVEIGKQKKHISKTSVQIFLDWAMDAQKRMKDEPSKSKKQGFDTYHKRSISFWQNRLVQANAE